MRQEVHEDAALRIVADVQPTGRPSTNHWRNTQKKYCVSDPSLLKMDMNIIAAGKFASTQRPSKGRP